MALPMRTVSMIHRYTRMFLFAWYIYVRDWYPKKLLAEMGATGTVVNQDCIGLIEIRKRRAGHFSSGLGYHHMVGLWVVFLLVSCCCCLLVVGPRRSLVVAGAFGSPSRYLCRLESSLHYRKQRISSFVRTHREAHDTRMWKGGRGELSGEIPVKGGTAALVDAIVEMTKQGLSQRVAWDEHFYLWNLFYIHTTHDAIGQQLFRRN
jgi:hypothetical protein